MPNKLRFLTQTLATPIGELVLISDEDGRLRATGLDKLRRTHAPAARAPLRSRYLYADPSPKALPASLSAMACLLLVGIFARLIPSRRHGRNCIPEKRLAGSTLHPRRRDDQLRRTRETTRQPCRRARRRTGQWSQSNWHRRALSSRDRSERITHRIRRRIWNASSGCSITRDSVNYELLLTSSVVIQSRRASDLCSKTDTVAVGLPGGGMSVRHQEDFSVSIGKVTALVSSVL